MLKGGRSLERGVSLRSGARVEDALQRLGHEPLPLDVGADLVQRLIDESPDAAFVALHGPGGEDGTVQELLEILDIPYTGPGVAACVRCMDKTLAKHELREAGIPTPDWFAFNATAFRELGAADALEQIEARLGFPLVVKPASGGLGAGREAGLPPRGGSGGARRRIQLRRPGAAGALRAGARAGGQRPRRRARFRSSRRSRARATSMTSRPATRSGAPTSSARRSSIPTPRLRSPRPRCERFRPSAARAFPAST